MNITNIMVGFEPVHGWFPARRITNVDTAFGFQSGNVQTTLDILTSSSLSSTTSIALLDTRVVTLEDGYSTFKQSTTERLVALEGITTNLSADLISSTLQFQDNYSSLNGTVGNLTTGYTTKFNIVDTFLESNVEKTDSLRASLNSNVATLEDSIRVGVDNTRALAEETTVLTSEFNGHKAVALHKLDVLANDYTTIANEHNTLKAEYDGNIAIYNELLGVEATADGVKASKLEELKTKYTGLVATTAEYVQKVNTASLETSSFVNLVTTLEANYQSNYTTVDGQLANAVAAISDLEKQVDGVIETVFGTDPVVTSEDNILLTAEPYVSWLPDNRSIHTGDTYVQYEIVDGVKAYIGAWKFGKLNTPNPPETDEEGFGFWRIKDHETVEALSAALNAAAVADGKIVTYYQPEIPIDSDSPVNHDGVHIGIGNGDYWVDSNDNNHTYRYNNPTDLAYNANFWVSIRDTYLNARVETIEGAFTGDGKLALDKLNDEVVLMDDIVMDDGEVAWAHAAKLATTVVDGVKTITGWEVLTADGTGDNDPISVMNVQANEFHLKTNTGYEQVNIVDGVLTVGDDYNNVKPIQFIGDFATEAIANASGTIEHNMVYKNTTDGNSYIYINNNWQLFLAKGTSVVNDTNEVEWVFSYLETLPDVTIDTSTGELNHTTNWVDDASALDDTKQIYVSKIAINMDKDKVWSIKSKGAPSKWNTLRASLHTSCFIKEISSSSFELYTEEEGTQIGGSLSTVEAQLEALIVNITGSNILRVGDTVTILRLDTTTGNYSNQNYRWNGTIWSNTVMKINGSAIIDGSLLLTNEIMTPVDGDKGYTRKYIREIVEVSPEPEPYSFVVTHSVNMNDFYELIDPEVNGYRWLSLGNYMMLDVRITGFDKVPSLFIFGWEIRPQSVENSDSFIYSLIKHNNDTESFIPDTNGSFRVRVIDSDFMLISDYDEIVLSKGIDVSFYVGIYHYQNDEITIYPYHTISTVLPINIASSSLPSGDNRLKSSTGHLVFHKDIIVKVTNSEATQNICVDLRIGTQIITSISVDTDGMYTLDGKEFLDPIIIATETKTVTVSSGGKSRGLTSTSTVTIKLVSNIYIRENYITDKFSIEVREHTYATVGARDFAKQQVIYEVFNT